MSDLSIEYAAIQRLIYEKHTAYMDKFGESMSLLEGNQQLIRTRISAKLKLLVRAFVEAGVVDSISSVCVSSRDGTFPMSLSLGKNNNPIQLHLLNTGRDVILSDSVGLALSMDTLDTRIILVTDTKRVCKKFIDVLNPSFDWQNMAINLLVALHEVIYDGHEASALEFINTVH